MASSGGGGACRRQRRMGPAPFASFEDLSDETDSPGESGAPAPRLPGIHEDVTPCRLTPSTPRIDISRASSSSHHEDSRDSTPERELFQTPGQRLGLAFREEGAMELRSSTEELDFQEPLDLGPRRSLGGGTTTSVTVAISAQSEHQSLPQHQRKDSQSSDFGGLLSISGRTSRLSSIGSQGSRVSNASHLSVTSGMSRSPSPHKMLLETSFCGSKTGNATNAAGTQNANSTKLVETELLERVLLSRKHDPTEAILAEGISIECRRKIQPADSLVQLSPVLQHMHAPDEEIEVVDVIEEPPPPPPQPVKPRTPVPPEKPARKAPPPPPPKVLTDVIITVDRPTEDTDDSPTNNNPNLIPGKTIVAESGIEYTFIPLKGPLPSSKTGNCPAAMKANSTTSSKVNSVPVKTNRNATSAASNTTASSGGGDPEYIRIKLKPDHMYTDEPQSETHIKPATLDLSNGGTAQPVIIRSPRPNNSNTPSPSVSRKSSFASLFRAKEYGTSPESPTQISTSANRRKSPRSRSKSSDRERTTTEYLDKPTKHRSVFTLFKSKKSHHKSKQSLAAEASPPGPASSLHSLEFTFDRPPPPVKKYYEVPLDGDSIIIPLHSPSGETPAPLSQQPEPHIVKDASQRQSSTSSENLVFTTNLGGSDNEIFTTKLPKRNERLVEKTNTGNPASSVESTNVVETNKKEHRQPSPTKPLLPIQNGLVDNKLSSPPAPVEKQLEKVVVEQEWIQTDVVVVVVDEKLSVDCTNADLDLDADTSEQQIIDGNDSSESENDALLKSTSKQTADEDDELSSEHERKGLVLQQDSFEDELPYVPTTLPLERSVAVPIVPVKQRATYEIKTCPIERPRSTTPINPSCLEDYCEDAMTAVPVEKLRISLPKDESSPATTGRVKSPRRWTEFVPKQPKEQQQQQQVEPAPPLPPRGAPKDWINFEEIPERRKAPKRIQTIPSRGALQPQAAPTSLVDEANVVYSYVNPEDCKCECHETAGRTPGTAPPTTVVGGSTDRHDEEDELPLLMMASSDRRRSDSSSESQAAPPPEKRGAGGGVKPANAFPHVAKTSS